MRVLRRTGIRWHFIRGDKWDKQTTATLSLPGWGRELDLAEQQVLAALRVDPRTLAGYWLLLDIAQGRDDLTGANEVLRRALRVRPLSVRTHIRYMLLLQPNGVARFRT